MGESPPLGVKMRKKVLEPLKTPYKILHCRKCLHWKRSEACIALRAKKVCREDCKGFFEWAKENENLIKEVVEKNKGAILNHLKTTVSTEDLMVNVMPHGDHICEFCGKAFKLAKGLEKHKRKH